MINLTRSAAVNEASVRLQSAGVEGPRRDAERLLCHVLGIPRTTLIAYSELELSPDERADFNRLVARRATREPLPYILGSHSFLDFDLVVGQGVLIPRPETELLVEVVSTYLQSVEAPASIGSPLERLLAMDVGTGTGAVAAGLTLHHSHLAVIGTDISPEALEIARRNIDRLGVSDRVHLVLADLLPATPSEGQPVNWLADWGGLVAAIASNPPYIRSADILDLQPEVSIFEPRLALDGGPDGLRIILRLIHESRQWLRSGGLLAFEVGSGQALTALRLLRSAGYADSRTYEDLAGIERVVTGIWN